MCGQMQQQRAIEARETHRTDGAPIDLACVVLAHPKPGGARAPRRARMLSPLLRRGRRDVFVLAIRRVAVPRVHTLRGSRDAARGDTTEVL